jgi:hypothetical protein
MHKCQNQFPNGNHDENHLRKSKSKKNKYKADAFVANQIRKKSTMAAGIIQAIANKITARHSIYTAKLGDNRNVNNYRH